MTSWKTAGVKPGGDGTDMDFELTEDQRAFQATARTFARSEMMSKAKDWDEHETFPVDTLREAAEPGISP